jgi:hypothetical protein
MAQKPPERVTRMGAPPALGIFHISFVPERDDEK